MLQVLLAILWLLLVPFGCGMWLTSGMKKEHQNIGMIYLNGYLIMIAFFQCVYLAYLLVRGESFLVLVWSFGVVTCMFSVFSAWKGRKILKPCIQRIKSKEAILLKVVFAILLAGQLVMRLLQQVSDGDDAYYVATAAATYTSDTINLLAPYTGYIAGAYDYRHVFASAPIWLAFLSEVTMIPPAVMAHSVLSLVLIVLHYIIVLNVGEVLFRKKEKEKYLFANIVSLFNIYGFVSIYTAQTFLLTRTWQGKSMFANIFLPMMILTLLWLGEKKEQAKEWIIYSLIAVFAMVGGTATTLLAVVMLPAVFMLGNVILAICHKSVRKIWHGALACVPVVLVAIVYVLVRMGG